MKKRALKDQHGLFQSFQSNVTDYNTRESYLEQRGGKYQDPQKLYGIGPEHPESYQPKNERPGSLSTRYVPGRPGVQALRVSTGVFQDPHTKETFDYNEGFITQDGRVFRGGTVDLQTDLVTLANRLDKLGLVKEASFLDSILLKVAEEMDPYKEMARTLMRGSYYAASEFQPEELSGLTSKLRVSLTKDKCREILAYLDNIPRLEDESVGLNKMLEDETVGLDRMSQEDFLDDVGHNPELSRDILAAAMSSAPKR